MAPRSPAGIHSRMTRAPAGLLVASPAPIARRVARSETKPVDRPVAAVASDQSVSPKPATRFAPNRSTSRPIGIRNSAYVHRNDENKYPRETGSNPYSLAIGPAAKDRVTRSM